ncbi:MAG: nucleotidyltransferase family protein [Porphyromonadaceae bacterium]|uniref:nucleotidyltransferase family protein n=1 Tax=Butyricimonas virosa TaxID=544645 RepID=UPI0026DA8EA2|nr:nucleotidyltransferase family protein [Butyricimonas virosa]MBS5626365.1 nucleotidyltransferase family protein [Porphyromonadaceae bacterium]
MIITKIQNRIVQLDISIFQAMKKMDEEKIKMLFVFDKEEFISILTIGDIQRAIIKKNDLSVEIREIIDTNKVFARSDEDINIIKSQMVKLRAECMPILNNKGRLVNVLFWNDLFLDGTKIDDRKINLPVVIMAGGKGTRLKPLTNVIPKPLVPIGEKTILEEIMNQFEAIGCTEFYMSVNYKYDILEFYLNQLEHKYNISFFKEEKPLGTIGSVSLLKDKINTPFFVSNCDILIDQDLRDVYDYHVENKNDITIITAVKNLQIPYGVIETTTNGVMTGLAEKPEFNYMINTGVYILQPDLIYEIPENEFFHITHLMEKVRTRGGRIGCFPVSENSWRDIGEWGEYLNLLNLK